MRFGSLLVLALVAASCGSAPKPSPTASRAALNRDTAVADGADEVIVTITVIGDDGKPLEGALPKVESTGDGNVITPTAGTNAEGVAYVRFASTVAELKTLKITLPGGEIPANLAATFVAGPADHLRFMVQPSVTMAGVPIAPAVRVGVVDAHDNTTMEDATITVESDKPLGGTRTIASVAGIATFNSLVVAQATAGLTLRASAPGLGGATSQPFDVVTGTAARLVFKMQPQSAAAGATMATVVVEVQDAAGNRIPTATIPVTLAMASGSSALGGTTKVNAVAGVATFADLNVTRAGSYALAATGPGFAGDVSSMFTISPGPATTVGFTTPPALGVTSCVAGTSVACSFPVQAAVTDQYGNAVPTAPATTLAVTLKTPAPNGAVLTGGGSKTTSMGVANYTLSLDHGGVGFVLTVGGSVNSMGVSKDSAPFDVRHLVVVGNGGAMTFSPSALTVKVGDTVRWTLAGNGHTVVSGTAGTADATFCGPAGAVVNAGTCQMNAAQAKSGDTFEYTVPVAGTKSYFCSQHYAMGMTGSVTAN